MEFLAAQDVVQTNALQGAALLFLHGMMLVSAAALGLLSLLCLCELWPDRARRSAAPKSKQHPSRNIVRHGER